MITVALKREWDWTECIVCGNLDHVQTRGLMLIGRPKQLKVARLAWCHETTACNDDRRSTDFIGFNEQEAREFDLANGDLHST